MNSSSIRRCAGTTGNDKLVTAGDVILEEPAKARDQRVARLFRPLDRDGPGQRPVMIGQPDLREAGAAVDAGIAEVVDQRHADDRQRRDLVGLTGEEGPVRRHVPFAIGLAQTDGVLLAKAEEGVAEFFRLAGGEEVHLDAAADLAHRRVDLRLDAEARLVGVEEDEFIVVLVEPILARHRERELVGIAVEIIDHVPLDVTIDDDLGHRRRHVGGRGDRDGEARIVILVDAVARPVLSHEVHARATLEGDEACARRKVGSLLGRLLLEGVHAGLKCLELRLQIG